MATEQMLKRMVVMFIIMLRLRMVLEVSAGGAEDVRLGQQTVAQSQKYGTSSCDSCVPGHPQTMAIQMAIRRQF